jgi:uncharacterized protein
VFEARMPMTLMFQTQFLPVTIVGTAGIAAFGLALYRLGFLTGAMSNRVYTGWIIAGCLAAVAYIPLIAWLVARNYDPLLMTVTNQMSLMLRPFMALGYVSAVILILRQWKAPAMMARVEAAGRMAFSNYLGTSIVATTIFYGYGFGLFGHLSRWQLYLVVLGVWALILLWSKPWLDHFRYGPFEWLWRSMARGQWQAFHKP